MAVKCIRHLCKIRAFQIAATQCRNLATSIPDNEGGDNSLDTKRLASLRRLLKSKNLVVKDGFTCLLLPSCHACQAVNQSAAYINKRTGLFICPSCDITKPFGAISDIYERNQHFNQIEQSAAPYNSKFNIDTEVTSEACSRLGIRGLREADVKAAGGQYIDESDLFRFMLKNNAQRIVGEKVIHLKDKQEETFQNKNNSGLLEYGSGSKNKAIIVTNLLDYLALVMQRLDSYAIICLPYGLKYLPQECLPALERYKELIFWFKFDSAGWDVAKNFSSKLDEKRCLLIRPTDTEPAPMEAHQKRLNLRHILTKATPVQHKSITTFSALRNDILSELQNIEKVSGIKWKRFPILNKLLKGHRKGELTILTGPTGSGKTTFVSEYSLDLALQGVSTLWGSFEIRNSRLAATLLRQFVGYSLENKLNEFDYWAERFEKYPLYFMTFHGQQPLKVVMDAIEHAQYVYDINHVIIDNLQFMMGISMTHRTDKFWEQDSIIAAFRGFATKHNVHVTLVMHPRKERETDDLTTSSIFGTAKATQEADNVLIIQDKRLTSLRGKKYLQVAKNRYSGDLGIMPLDFDKESLSYSPTKKKIEQKEKSKTVTL